MGKGDKKTAKGKRTMGSYGNTRKRKSEKSIVVVAKPKKEKVTEDKVEVKKTAVKKPAVKKTATNKSESSKKKEK